MAKKRGFAQKLAEAAIQEKKYGSLEEMFTDLLPDLENAESGELYAAHGGLVFEKPSKNECLACGEMLVSGECPNGCTEEDDYGFLQGFYFGDEDSEGTDE